MKKENLHNAEIRNEPFHWRLKSGARGSSHMASSVAISVARLVYSSRLHVVITSPKMSFSKTIFRKNFFAGGGEIKSGQKCPRAIFQPSWSFLLQLIDSRAKAADRCRAMARKTARAQGASDRQWLGARGLSWRMSATSSTMLAMGCRSCSHLTRRVCRHSSRRFARRRCGEQSPRCHMAPTNSAPTDSPTARIISR